MNEIIFFAYILITVIANTIALQLGKEALIGLVCTQVILANLFVAKEIILCGFRATASDSLAIGITLCLNLLQEYYSLEVARKAIWISFFCALVYVACSILHVAYIPSPTDTCASHYAIILSPMPRIITASLFVYLLVQYLDSAIYKLLLSKFKHKFFIARNYISISISQFIDTVLFSFLGLWGLNASFSKIQTILEIIFVSYIIKLIAIFISAPLLSLTKKIITLEKN